MNQNRFKQIARRGMLSMMAVFAALAVNAIPAKPGLTKTITLDNGQTVKVRLVGDEFGHYWKADDGKCYQQDVDASTFHVVDAQAIAKSAAAKRAARDANNRKRLGKKKVGEFGDYTGEKRCLIILVNYKDTKFKTTNNKALFERIANEENFNEGNFVGSMYDYFKKQSDGKFELTFDIAGPVTVSRNASYYGQNDWNGDDLHAEEMVIEAIQLADPEVNYADYDWDGDGYVDQVYLIYAGKGEADGGAATTIWPHQSDLELLAQYGYGTGAVQADGVKVSKYACGGELNGQTGNVNGIGTMCHEFSHCLGYPDFYDTDYSGGQGMGMWDLMCSGSYNGDGYRPAGYTSYERWMAGWHEPIELVYSKEVTGMKSLQDGGESYIIYNEGNRNEYFMLENRQKTDWDAALPGKGLLIVHVDYDATIWANNKPNDDPSHQRMTWIPADGVYDSYGYGQYKEYYEEGMVTDPYPNNGNKTFNKSSNPAAKFYNTNADGTYFMSSSVEDITQNSDGTISFNFAGLSGTPAPELTPKAGVYDNAVEVTITCETEGAEVYYTTDGTTPTEESTKYTGAFTVSESATVKAVAVADDVMSNVVKARYIIRKPVTDVNTYKRVSAVSELENGKRYIIACGSKNSAAGAMNSNALKGNKVTRYDDIIIADENVAVFTLDIDNDNYSFFNEEGKFLYSTKAKNLDYSDGVMSWTVNDDASGVTMTYGTFGTMLYSSGNNKFTTYTSKPTSSLIYANLYEQYEIAEKLDATLSYENDEYTTVLGNSFTAPTLTVNPAGLAVTYSSSDENVATVNEKTGAVAVNAAGTTVVTATFAGDEVYNTATASYTLIVNEPAPEPIEVNIDATGFTTLYYGSDALIVPENTTARTYVFDDNKKLKENVVYSSGDVIPANEPVVVEGVEGKYIFNFGETATTPDAQNVLSGTDEAATISESGYKFFMLMLPEGEDDNRIGFYMQNEDGNSITIDAHRAYLRMGAADAAEYYLLNDVPSGISSLEVMKYADAEGIYTIDGRRLQAPQKGMNIVRMNNGKVIKVIVK